MILRFKKLSTNQIFGLKEFSQREISNYADFVIIKPDYVSWRDWTIFLLNSVIEIEHSLMVQYLFAGYSLDEKEVVSPNNKRLVKRWRRVFLKIAKEEMGHFLMVQNILRVVQGGYNMDRQDFPFRSELYPFEFKLEKLSLKSLSKYVIAEMPVEIQITEEIKEIIKIATDNNSSKINHVGILFEELVRIFNSAEKLPDENLNFRILDQSQRQPWRANGQMILTTINSRQQIIEMLTEVAEQGEGEGNNQTSHFENFLKIYREFPKISEWKPSKNLVDNPSIKVDAVNTIKNDEAIQWAHLFNLHYRRLLFMITHSIVLSTNYSSQNEMTLRGYVTEWALIEMRGFSKKGGLKGISKVLTSKLFDETIPGIYCGPTFELPYTNYFPDKDLFIKPYYSDFVKQSNFLINKISDNMPDSNEIQVLEELKTLNLTIKNQFNLTIT